MTTLASRRRAMGVWPSLRSLTPALLLALAGVEIAVLAHYLPDTLETWWVAGSTGDFGNFYHDAQSLDVNGLYSPGLSLVMYPLTWLSLVAAFRVYLALGALALLALAFLAQRSVQASEGKLAVVLGVISLPQMHWALRLGHLTPFLALAALAGFLLLKRRPLLAGVCFALLVLKPQYAVLPGLYLLWTRNGRALAGMAAATLAIELAGFAAVGFGEMAPYLGRFFDLSADARDNLLPYQQAWQYAWQGFLVSAHIEPNPLLALDLSLLSLGAIVLVWARAARSAAMAAAALGMLIVTPYANFYDWGLLAVAIALLLRARVSWQPALPLLAVALFAALVAAQAATPFPAVDVGVGAIGAAGGIDVLPAGAVFPTRGVYWVTPLALAVVALLLVLGRRDEAPAAGRELMAATPSIAPRLALAGALIPAAYFASAAYAHVPPFTHQYDPFSPSEVMKQLPADFPLPEDRSLQRAGRGDELPYRIEWTSGEPVSEVAGIYRGLLAEDDWELMLEEETSPAYRIRLAHFSPYGFMTHWAMLDVSPWRRGSKISLDLFVTEALSLALEGGGVGESP